MTAASLATLPRAPSGCWQLDNQSECISNHLTAAASSLPSEQLGQTITGGFGLLQGEREHVVLALEVLHVAADLLDLHLELLALVGEVLLLGRTGPGGGGVAGGGGGLSCQPRHLVRGAARPHHGPGRLQKYLILPKIFHDQLKFLLLIGHDSLCSME